MENEGNEILDSNFVNPGIARRRDLLPWWIKIFTWIFLVFGTIVPVGLLLGIFGFSFQLALYGLSTNTVVSIVGLIISAIFLIKGTAAFALWFEKDWAIDFAQITALTGIAICIFMMIVHPFIDNFPGFRFTFRAELLILIPFLAKLGKIKANWKAIVTVKE